MDFDSKKHQHPGFWQVIAYKFTLIAWKKFSIQMFYKKTILKLFALSFLALPIILVLTFTEPTVQKKRIFNTIKVDNINKLRESIENLHGNKTNLKMVFKICYMPKNALYEKVIQRTVEKLELLGFEAVDTYKDMTTLMQTKHYMAGISFDDANKNITSLPTTLKYRLHFRPLLSTEPTRKNWVTNMLYPPMAERLARKPNSEVDDTDYGIPPAYVREGFIPLQHAIFMSYLELFTGTHLAKETFPEIVMSKFPVRRYFYDPFFIVIKIIIPVVVLSTYLLPSYYIVKQLAVERESRIIQILPISRSLNWFVWFVILMAAQCLSSMISTFILNFKWLDRTAVYEYSDWTTILCFLCCYVSANTTFLFMISVVFIPNSGNAIYVILVHLISFTPYLLIIIFYYDTPMAVKLLSCLMLNTGLALGLNIIMDFEHTEEGSRWSNINSAHFAGDDFSLYYVCVMLLLSSVLHIVILVYVDLMYPLDYNVISVQEDSMARNWYYPVEYLWKQYLKLIKNRKKCIQLRNIGKFLFKSITAQDDNLYSSEQGGYGHPRLRQVDDKNTQTLPSNRGKAPPAATPSPIQSPTTSIYQSIYTSHVPSRVPSNMEEQDPDVDLLTHPRTSKSVTPSIVPSSSNTSHYQSPFESPFPSREPSYPPSQIPSNILPIEEQNPTILVRRRSEVSSQYQSPNQSLYLSPFPSNTLPMDPDADLIVYPQNSRSTMTVRRRSKSAPSSLDPSSPSRVSSHIPSHVSSSTSPMEELRQRSKSLPTPSINEDRGSMRSTLSTPIRFELHRAYSTSTSSSTTQDDLQFFTETPRDMLRDEDIEVDEDPIVNELLFDDNRGIQLINISKSYKCTTYLNDITMNIHPNEITVVLSRQGTGKQLLMHIIAGAIPMSSGKVIVNGVDIKHKDMSASFAIMPKQKICFSELSARENLYFYVRLRSMHHRRVMLNREIRRYLKKLDLTDMADLPVAELSYGMERRLALCCALCGGNHTVICDEPTLGLDKRNRYHMWDLLRLEGRSRTIIVFSKYNAEADVLGDRIAVLFSGQLKCYDRTAELHRKFCSAYNLKGVKSQKNKFNLNGLMSVLYRHIPHGVRIERNTDHHIDLCLPSLYKNKLSGVMRDLEKRGTQYGLTDCWLQHRTLLDAFMVSPPLENNDETSTIKTNDGTDEEQHYVVFDKYTVENDPRKRIWLKFSAIFRKKIAYFKQKWWIMLIILALIPYFLYSEYTDGIKESHYLPPLKLNLNTYKATVIVMKMMKDVKDGSMAYLIGQGCREYHEKFESIEKNDHKFIKLKGNHELVPYILFQGHQSVLNVETFYLGGLNIEPNKVTCFWNDKLIHSTPIIINLVHNSLARTFMGKQAEVLVVNSPIKFASQNYLARLKKRGEVDQGVSNAMLIITCIIIALLTLPIISESTSGTRLLQFIGGVSFHIYWLTEFICDYIVYEFIAIYQIIVITIYTTQLDDKDIGQNTDLEMLMVMVLLLLLHGVAVLPFSYILTFPFKNVINGFVTLIFILIGSSFLAMELIEILQTVSRYENFSKCIDLFRWSPTMNLLVGLKKLHIASEQHSTCAKLGGCEGDEQCCLIQPYISVKSPGILLDIIILVILAVVYNLVLSQMKPFVMENFHRGRRERRGSTQSAENNENDDRRVVSERQRIYGLHTKDRETLPLVVQDISKKKGNRELLFNVAFAVRRNDVFGLVGVFGSGKSTIIKHVVGLASIDTGNVFIHGIDARTNMRQAQEHFGYCPRSNALFNHMTVREIFKFYSKLQCRKSEYVPQITNELAKAFRLTDKLDVRIKHLIYATRRKLNVALAVLCGHSIVILDNPTNGMDPNGRLEVWRMIKSLHRVGRTVVLATDSIEECIAVCNRIGIMVNGRIKALGNSDQLTTQYSRGCMVRIYESNHGTSRRLNEKIKYDYSGQLHKKSLMGYNFHSGSDRTTSTDESLSDRGGFSDAISRMELVSGDDIDVDQVRLYLKNMSSFKVNQDWEKRAYRYKDIKSFMLNELSTAKLHEEYENRLVYYIPFNTLPISQVFELMESITGILNIIDYNISRTSVVDIYEEFAKERARLWNNEPTVEPTKLRENSRV